MDYSYFKFFFSDICFSVAVALPFLEYKIDTDTYKHMWKTIENNFRTKRSSLLSFDRITEDEFERNLIKLDFRYK